MGVKSTIDLTMVQAEQKYIELRMPKLIRKCRLEIADLTNSELERALEDMNDKAHDGEGFENYRITAA